MRKSRLFTIFIIIEVIIALYLVYILFLKNDKPNDKPIVTPTPIVTIKPTPVITPEPTPMPTPTITPIPTPEPTPEPEKDKKEMIYNNIYLTYKENKKVIKPSKSSDNSIILLVEGTGNNLYYEIVINSSYNSNTVISKLTFNLQEIDENEKVINHINIDKFNTLENRVIYTGNISGSINKRYKLQITGDSNDISVNVRVTPQKSSPPSKASNLVLNSINSHPDTTWTDTDGVIYFSGSNSKVNYNYVWYSGKLWRITAINKDGTLRLMTDNAMTMINWGKNVEYNGSWAYQWLNEDFYDTLYNPKNLLVQNVIWNYTTDASSVPKKPETLPNQKTVSAPIGLLTSYEYLNAYRNSSKMTDNFLNDNHYWWHITPQHANAVRSTSCEGKHDLYDRKPWTHARGIRPVIYLNNSVEFTGSGTKDNPYRIVGDIPNPNSNTLLNTRISGEYIKFDNDVYRIIDIIDGNTKIYRVDYLRKNRVKIEKHIARTIYFGRASNTQNEEWWDYYLKNIWYPTISQTYRNMVVNGTYYLGSYYLETHYKNTICTDANLDKVTVKNCTKYSDADHIYIGLVGLIRVGEMFSAQQLDIEPNAPTFWTITPYDDVENRIILETNSMWRHATWGGYHVVHPTLYLNKTVKIVSGSGTLNNPYIISE